MFLPGRKFPFTPQGIKAAPPQAGVYFLFDGAEVIYIGKSANIQSRLWQHHGGSEGSCTRSATDFAYGVAPWSDKDERQLLEEYRREHGRLPRCNDVMPSLEEQA